MNLAQRALLFLAGILFIIATFFVIFLDNLRIVDLLIASFMIFVPTVLFYYTFSTKEKKIIIEKEIVTTPVSQPLKAATVENSKKLDNLIKMTENRLFKLESVFPFDLFPDQIVIEQKQVVLKCSQFFASSQDYNILIKDILMPVVENSVFFSKLKIEVGPGGYNQNPPAISYLKKSEALRAKHIIMGLIMCDREKIDLSNETSETILKKVEDIGRVKED